MAQIHHEVVVECGQKYIFCTLKESPFLVKCSTLQLLLSYEPMRLTIMLLLILSLIACDDGDLIVTTFDFEDANLESCFGSQEVVFFKINNDPSESISLQIDGDETLFIASDTLTFNLDGNTNKVNYRLFNDVVGSSYFCSNVPPTSPEISQEYLASEGSATIFVIAELDDDDGLDAELEAPGDTDGDGLPDLYDFDDDGDNVPTETELGGNPNNPRDTDEDGIPDYLDTDDDNDGVLTRYEDANNDLDPTNDLTDPLAGPDYLNPEVSAELVIDQYRVHSFNFNSDARVLLNDLVLISGEEQIIQQSLDLGLQQGIFSGEVLVTPDFN